MIVGARKLPPPRRACASLVLACALLSGCYLAHERDAPAPRICTTVPADGCTSWEAAGVPTMISEPVIEYVQPGSAIATDCGVLAMWSVATYTPTVMNARHETRTIDWDGTPIDGVVTHPATTLEGSSSTTPLVARGPGGAAALIANGRTCLFVPLDLDGHDRGAPVTVATADFCGGLAGTPRGYSFFVAHDRAMPRFSLQSVDAAGARSSVTELTIPSDRVVWVRTVFDDGSFLAHSFTQDFVTSRYSAWLQRFDGEGTELGPDVEVGENGVPVLASPTSRGALAAWMTAASGGLPLRVRPVDRDGRPRGEARDLPAEGALYGFAIASTPDGDEVVSWTEWHFGETPEWRLRVMALGADGAMRGEPTTVLTEINTGAGQLLVEPSGGRALFLFSDDTGAYAQPLACVR